MRIPTLPRLRVPVLYVPAALEDFERAVGQVPEYEDDVVHGYVAATIYWNHGDILQRLERLAVRGVVWLPAADLRRWHEYVTTGEAAS